MSVKKNEISSNLSGAKRQLEDFYRSSKTYQEKYTADTISKQEQALRKQSNNISKYINEQNELYNTLNKAVIDLESTVTDKTKRMLDVSESMFRNLPNEVSKVFRKTLEEHNNLIDQLSSINQRGAEEQDVLQKKIVDYNVQVGELLVNELAKTETFISLQDQVFDRYERELGELRELDELNRSMHIEQETYIKKELSGKEKRNALDREALRFNRVNSEITNRERNARDAIQGAGNIAAQTRMGGSFNPLSLFHSGANALGLGGIFFTLNDISRNLKTAARDLREYRREIGMALATSASPQATTSLLARSQLYGLSREIDSVIEGGEKLTNTVGTTLARAGLPQGRLEGVSRQALGLGFSSGLGGEKIASMFDKLFRQFQVPVENLSGTFVNLQEHARKVGIPVEELFDNFSQLQQATKQYNYSLGSSVNLVTRFGHEIRRNILSIQDLIQAREGFGKTGRGERAYMMDQITQRLPDDLREAIQKVVKSAGGGAIAEADVLKAILEGQKEIPSLAGDIAISLESLGGLRDIIKQESLGVIQDMAKQISQSTTEQNLFIEKIAKQFVGLDLENLTGEQQQAKLLEAFTTVVTSGKGVAGTKTTEEQVKAGLKFAIDTSNMMQSINSGVVNIYRGIVDDLKTTFIKYTKGTEAAYEEMRLSPITGRGVITLENILGVTYQDLKKGNTITDVQFLEGIKELKKTVPEMNASDVNFILKAYQDLGAIKYKEYDKDKLSARANVLGMNTADIIAQSNMMTRAKIPGLGGDVGAMVSQLLGIDNRIIEGFTRKPDTTNIQKVEINVQPTENGNVKISGANSDSTEVSPHVMNVSKEVLKLIEAQKRRERGR